METYTDEELTEICEDAFVNIKEACKRLQERTKCSNEVVVSMLGNVAEFYNDVYVYGTLYADLFGNADFGDGLNINVQNLNVSGIATFNNDVFINAELYTDCFFG